MDLSKPTPSPATSATTRDADRALGTGVRVGAFEIQAVIAESAASLVYLASDRALETQVALKEYMPQRLARREGSRVVALPAHAEAYRRGLRAFHAAARTLARIDHPASPRALLLWEANSTAYLAMPYYPGTTLLELRRGMRLAPDEISLRALLDGLLGALDAYHRRDTIHGDVGPSKILLLPDDRPLLLGPSSVSARLATGASDRGAPFAAPEQLAPSPDTPLGPWTDLYALAAVLRFCITGRIADVTAAGAAAGERAPVYSTALLETLEMALSPQWERRPQSAQQFREWLGRGPHAAIPQPSGGDARGTESGLIAAGVARAAGTAARTGGAAAAGAASTSTDAARAGRPPPTGQVAPADPRLGVGVETSAAPRAEHDSGRTMPHADRAAARAEPHVDREPAASRHAGVFTSPPRAQAKAGQTLTPPQRPEPVRDKGRDGAHDDLREAGWIEQRHGLAPAIEPAFDFEPARVDPGDGREAPAWPVTGGSRRRRREVLLGSALLIVLAIGAALFATNAWKSMLPVRVDMDAAPVANQPADPGPMPPAATKAPPMPDPTGRQTTPTTPAAPPSPRQMPEAAPGSNPPTKSTHPEAGQARPEAGTLEVTPAPIEASASHAALDERPVDADPFPTPSLAAAKPAAMPAIADTSLVPQR